MLIKYFSHQFAFVIEPSVVVCQQFKCKKKTSKTNDIHTREAKIIEKKSTVMKINQSFLSIDASFNQNHYHILLGFHQIAVCVCVCVCKHQNPYSGVFGISIHMKKKKIMVKIN
jgi:hypothetical protein